MKHRKRDGRLPAAVPSDPPNPEAPILSTFAAVVKIADVRRRRAFALLAGEKIPNQDLEARLWGDRPRGAA